MTYRNTEPDEQDDESENDHRTQGLWAKFKDAFLRNNEDDDVIGDEDEDAVLGVSPIPTPSRSAGGSSTPLKRTANTLRLETARRTHVTVRRMVQSVQDVRRAVDGLREGVQQIINFEQTPADTAKELIDFMSGAIYALDGSVEQIGDQVFLFSPGNVIVDVEDKPVTASHTAFFDKG
jgi:FtsZ-interacting cell division protein YlmF